MDPSSLNFLSYVPWGEKSYYLQDLIKKGFPLPQIVKISKEQNSCFGSSNSSRPQFALLLAQTKQVKVAAQCIKIKPNGQILQVGSKISIPTDYEGLFELLSEDGKSARCIKSVADLYTKGLEQFIVRKDIKAYVPKDPNSRICRKTKQLCSGDILTIDSNLYIDSRKETLFIKCFTAQLEKVFLSFRQTGKFSPIAKGKELAGLHTVEHLLRLKFPLKVRLVYGKPPNGLKRSLFSKVMIFDDFYEEKSIAAITLTKDYKVVSFPLSTPLKIQVSKNWLDIMTQKDVVNLINKSCSLVQETLRSMKILDVTPPKERCVKNALLKIVQNKHTNGGFSVENGENDAEEEINSYDEIDLIYEYVRGYSPLPPKPREMEEIHYNKLLFNYNSTNCSDNSQNFNSEISKPLPPPIETLPGKHFQTKDRYQRFTAQNDTASSLSNAFHVYEKIRGDTSESKRVSETASNNGPKNFLSHPSKYSKKFLPFPAEHQRRLIAQRTRDPLSDQREKSKPKTIKRSFISSSIFNLRYKSQFEEVIEDENLANTDQRDSESIENSINGRSRSVNDICGDEETSADFVTPEMNNERKLVLLTDFLKGKISNKKACRSLAVYYL